MVFATLVASALLLTVARFWLLPQVNNYKPEIEARLSSIIHESLLIGKVSAGMSGVNPQLVLNDCVLAHSGGSPAVLEVRRVALTLDAAASLLAQSIRFRRIEIDDIQLTVHRHADGSIGLLGFSEKSESPAWLSMIGYLQLRNAALSWLDDRSETPTRQVLGMADAEFRSPDSEHYQLALRIDPSVEIGHSLNFAAQLHGDLFAPAALRGRFYLEGAGIKPYLLRDVELSGIKIQSGEADFKIWGDFNQGKPEQLTGKIALRHPAINYRAHAIQLGRLSAFINWRQGERQSELLVKKLSFATAEKLDAKNDLAMRIGWDAAGSMVELSAAIKALQVDEINALANTFPDVDNNTVSVLSALSPVGEIHALRLFYDAPRDAWAICGNFSGIGFNSQGKVPGIKGLNGSLCGTGQEGTVNLAMREGEIFGEQLWAKPLTIKSLNAHIDWRHDRQGVMLTGQNFSVQYKDTDVNLDFDFIAPSDSKQLPVLDLTGRASDFPAESIVEILPLFAMDKNAAQWLSGAFVSGRMSDVGFLFRGALAQFPFEGNEGIFEMTAHASRLQLHYDPSWPDLFDVEGRLLLKNSGYYAEIEQGRVDRFPLTSLRVNAPDYLHHPWVYIDGGFGGDLSGILSVLEHTPEKPLVDRLNWFGQSAGKVGFDLKMRLPLDEGIGDGEVEGTLTLDKVSMDLQQAGQSWGKLSQLNGVIRFSDSDIAAFGIKGRMFGGPLSIALDHDAGRVVLTAQGHLQAAELSKYYPHDVWKYISGEGAYSVNLSFPSSVDAPKSDNDIKLKVLSDLVGIEARLPYPFGKSKAAEQSASIEWDMFADKQSVMQVYYGKSVKARFHLSDRNRGFDLMLGQDSLPAVLPQPARRVYIDLPRFDVTPWQSFLSAKPVAGADRADYLPDSVYIKLGALSWQGKDYGALQLNADRKGNDWSGWFDARYGKGRFEYTHDGMGPGILDLNLDKILLDTGPGGSDEAVDPSSLPTLRVRSRSVDWQGHELGELQLEAEHWMHGLNISRVKLVSPYSSLQMQGSWMMQGSGNETRVVGSLSSDNLGDMLEHLGYAKDVRDTPAKSTFSFVWEGGPHQFSLAKLTGDMGFSLGRGGLLNVDPGLGRAALLLNLDTLRRLLILDFNNLFGQGLAYDSIRGKYHFGNGRAEASKMLIDAVVAEIAISGSIDLVKHQLDQRVDVMPHALAVLPFVGALVPGMVVGTAVNLAEALAGRDEANLTSNHYVIKGNWDNPQVYRVQGNLPLDMLGRAWTNLKEISGFGQQEEK